MKTNRDIGTGREKGTKDPLICRVYAKMKGKGPLRHVECTEKKVKGSLSVFDTGREHRNRNERLSDARRYS